MYRQEKAIFYSEVMRSGFIYPVNHKCQNEEEISSPIDNYDRNNSSTIYLFQDILEEAENTVRKRAWNSQFSGGLGNLSTNIH